MHPRTRGLPYQLTERSHCITIGEKLWKDVTAGRMFVCAAKSVDTHAPVEATPTTTVDKKNLDRTLSTDKRMIADIRRVNLSSPADQYYHVAVPTITDIARSAYQLHARFPRTLPITMTKRDIASAFRLLRLRPALCLAMLTELTGQFSGIDGGI